MVQLQDSKSLGLEEEAYSLRARTQGWEVDHYGAVRVQYWYEAWGSNMMRQVLWGP